ncbi:IFI30 [Symbiodinium pilosum]|uniref:IFI30 protein n=1 Tax=Symbiodinium pilosum TaxID=2952 RepID=A0A812NII4_SYMPI|nr:IFI30 [Symbiodinium pilosum]
MASKLLCLALFAPSLAETAQKVKVEFFAEAGCPFCRQAIAGPVNKTLSMPSVAAIMDFQFFPFGNAYFVTTECKGAGDYDMAARKCFNKNCGAGASQPPKDCFTGALVCQHGSQECAANRFLACAKTVAGENLLPFMSFTHCVEASYDTFSKDTVSACADASQIDKDAVFRCYSGSEGDDATVAQAKATPEHPGVPYLLVNGQAVEQPDDLLKTVCKAYQGSEPDACKSMDTWPTHPIILQV